VKPHINPLAIGAAALVAFLIGGLWYSPVAFARPWMEANGFTVDSLKAAAAWAGSSACRSS